LKFPTEPEKFLARNGVFNNWLLKMNKYRRIVSYAFFGIIIAIALLLIISRIPLPGNYKVMMVLSGSMEPKIKTGSVVIVKPLSDYKEGEVISFKEPENTDRIVTHRIVKVISGMDGVYYQTKGDANDAPDWTQVPKENVIGKVLFSIPYLGYVLNGIRQPVIFTLLIIVPSTIIIYEEIKKVKGEFKKKKQYKKIVEKRNENSKVKNK